MKEKDEKSKAGKPEPSWPRGLPLSPGKDIACFIPEDLAVILSREAFGQLFGYAYSTADEICCLGTVRQEGKRFRIERFYLVPQTGSLGHTELDQGAVAALVEALIAQGKAEEAHSLTCWAHSHPGMDVFWSETDEATCKRLVTDYLISLVVSDGFAIRCRVDVGGAVPFTIDHVPVLVETSIAPDSLERYAAEVKEKVKHTPLLLSGSTSKTQKEKEAMVSEYCETGGSFHVQRKCPSGEEPFDQEAWEEYVRQCRAEGLEPDGEEFEMYGLDNPEFWF